MYFIYLTINTVNGKQYIGKHSGEPDDPYLGSGSLLKRAIRKYGKDKFVREILAITEDQEGLDLLEKHYIEKYNAINNTNFYNLTEGGTGGDTLKFLTESQRAKRSQKIKDQIATRDREAWSKIQSDNLKRVRKDPTIEAKRIETLKSTHKKKSRKQIKEEYATRSGGNAYQAKPVETPAGSFDCASDAAKHHRVHTQTVLNRCKNDNFKDWRFR